MTKGSWIAVVFLVIVVLTAFGLGGCFYVVDERESAIVTLFGEIKGVDKDPGLRVKNPLAEVTKYPKLVQEYNKEPSNTVTLDKKNLLVSFYVKYRISDVLKYAQTVRVKRDAEKRIDDIVYSALKTTISRQPFDAVVINRGDIEHATLDASQRPVEQYGITLVDFRVKRTDIPQQIVSSVYQRMTEERRQKAQMDRSEGEKQKAIMTASAQKRETEILSEAYKKKQEIMGEGDREALRILTENYGRDVEFAMFIKTLDLYKNSLRSQDTRLVLSTRSELLKFLQGPFGAPKK